MGTRALVCLPRVMLHLHTHISSAVQALSLLLFPQVLGEDLLASGRKKTTAQVHRPQGSKSPFFFFFLRGEERFAQSRPGCHWEPLQQDRDKLF